MLHLTAHILEVCIVFSIGFIAGAAWKVIMDEPPDDHRPSSGGMSRMSDPDEYR